MKLKWIITIFRCQEKFSGIDFKVRQRVEESRRQFQFSGYCCASRCTYGHRRQNQQIHRRSFEQHEKSFSLTRIRITNFTQTGFTGTSEISETKFSNEINSGKSVFENCSHRIKLGLKSKNETKSEKSSGFKSFCKIANGEFCLDDFQD